MAELNTHWVKLDDKTLQWAKTQHWLWKLEDEINKCLINNTIDYDSRADFEGYIDKIKQIRGF